MPLSEADAHSLLTEAVNNDASWTSAEERAVNSYTGSRYRQINGELRSGEVSPLVQRVVNNIDSLMERASLPATVTTYRGILVPELTAAVVANNIKGYTLEDRGYGSSSLSHSSARGFSNVIARIVVPKGSRAVYVDPKSQSDGERELLLPRGYKIRFTGNVEAYGKNGYMADAVLVKK